MLYVYFKNYLKDRLIYPLLTFGLKYKVMTQI